MKASALPQGRADISLASTPDELLTAEEVAVLLRVTPAWVYSQTRGNRIPHLRLGRPCCRLQHAGLDRLALAIDRMLKTPRAVDVP